MATDDDDKELRDPKVKALVERGADQPLEQLVDAQTAAQLARWFGLPSFAQVEAGEVEVPSTEIEEMRARRLAAVAAVDPALVEAIVRRATPREDIVQFRPTYEPVVDPSIARFDPGPPADEMDPAEPRRYQQPEDIEEGLKENVPQALLRDLHRVETDFYRVFETVDMAAEQRFDAAAEVASVMRTRWIGAASTSVVVEMRAAFAEGRAERARPWNDIPNRVNLPNRVVTE